MTRTPADVPRPINIVLVGLLAFALRVAVIATVPLSAPFSDMAEYHARAAMLLEEGRFYPDSWRGPGYPLFLTLLSALPGQDLMAARIGQAVLGGITAALTSVLARAFVGRGAALLAGVIVAVYPGLVLSSVYLMPEGLYTCLLMGALVLAMHLDTRRGAMAGLLTGCAMLTRSVGIAVIPAIAAGGFLEGWRAGRRWARPVASTVPMVLACAITVAPWLVHTSRVSGGPMLDSNAAYNMLAGNNPRATGRLEIADGTWAMATYLGDAIDEAERNRRAIRESWAWIRDHPLAWLRLVPVKISYLWGLEGREHAFLYATSYWGARSAATVWTWGGLLLVSFPLLVLAATVGLLSAGLTRQVTGVHVAVLLTVVTMLHVLSFGESRFHLPLIPVLAVLAVRGAAARRGLTRGRCAACAVVVLALSVGWASQAPELVGRLYALASPDRWRSWLPY